MEENYFVRITDFNLKQKLETFGGVLIVGPKGCGKTTSAKKFAKTIIEFQNEDSREQLLTVANTMPSKLLLGPKPILFDEWQDAPKIWGAIRKNIDDNQVIGGFILTGSSAKIVETPHTGTLRISTLKMYPFSLFECGESNGEISLQDLFNNPQNFSGCISELTIDDLIYDICCGGWPSIFQIQDANNKLLVANDLFEQTCNVDISKIDKVKRNPELAKLILKSYARNICTFATDRTILADVSKGKNVSLNTMLDYIEKLKQYVNSLIIVLNDNLLAISNSRIKITDAFKQADTVLEQGIKSITDLITTVGEVNVDFADIRTILGYKGMAYMGIGTASGEKRMLDAVKQAIENPLTENKINNAKGVIFNVRGNSGLELSEIGEGLQIINDLVDTNANIIFGTLTDDSLQDEIVVTVIATGVEEREEK